MERGGWGSFTGILTYKTAEPIRAACRLQGIDRLMVETDAPYLAPEPYRGKINEPGRIVYTAAALAQVKGMSVDALASATSDNFFRLFRIDPDAT